MEDGMAEVQIRTGFAQRLRALTRAAHEEVESRPFVRALLAGRVEADGFAALLAQRHFAYRVLEDAADRMRSDLIAGPFVSDRLHRLPALEADLHYYLGPDWRGLIRPSAATEVYCARLRELCFDRPECFVAHHYARYLGDLSGGQVLRAALSRSLGLVDDGGFAFLTFEEIPNRPRFKDAYRTLLDTAGWDGATENRIIAEVRHAFALNAAVLDELGRRLVPPIPRSRR
ncbi:heme oxygenase (biliverdin-producing) [Saccharopolyspora sp. CA-218241]|uniref:biliverdin-producing heme oxygenase n=1 Tax=Saccharopolyspora sp. CA-218241 TaxID=3240027 RepID=UPI003D9670DB